MRDYETEFSADGDDFGEWNVAPPLRQRRSRSGRRRRRRGRLWLVALVLLLAFAAGFVCAWKIKDSEAVGKWPFGPKDNVPEVITPPDYVQTALLTPNPYSRPELPLTRVNDVIIHYVGNPDTTAAQNRSYFEGLAESGATYASSNLIVGMDGECLLTVPLDEVAYCSNSRNEDSVSIEFCHPDDSGAPTEATYARLVELTAWLLELYGLDEEHILRHYDVSGKGCPRYFVENEAAWEQFRADVGEILS